MSSKLLPLAIVMMKALNHELNHKKCFIWWRLICHYSTVVYRIWYEKKRKECKELDTGRREEFILSTISFLVCFPFLCLILESHLLLSFSELSSILGIWIVGWLFLFLLFWVADHFLWAQFCKNCLYGTFSCFFFGGIFIPQFVAWFYLWLQHSCWNC